MEHPHVLIVDNEPEIRELLKVHLRDANMHVTTAASGMEAISTLREYTIDLIVLDLMMDHMDGWDVLKHMQSRQMNTPVIVLSAMYLEEDKIQALELGADDYVTKPFSPGELVARIKALLRRYKPIMKGTKLECGSLVYDRSVKQLHKPSGTVSLSPIEGEMLELLMRQPGHVFTKEEIFKYVWNLDEFDPNSLNVYINYLRRKIEDDPTHPRYIETIRGVGYRFVEDAP